MTHRMHEFKEVERHYTQSNLERAIFEALEAAGKDPNQLTLPDLAPIDEFHIRGREATEELASEIWLDSEKHVLDVGCGLGGPSRRLASQFGCRVTGLDLTEEYCRVAEVLSKRLGLDQLVSYIQGNALEMPFDDATFDVVWTQHASMNIPDKVGLYDVEDVEPSSRDNTFELTSGLNLYISLDQRWKLQFSYSFIKDEFTDNTKNDQNIFRAQLQFFF